MAKHYKISGNLFSKGCVTLFQGHKMKNTDKKGDIFVRYFSM